MRPFALLAAVAALSTTLAGAAGAHFFTAGALEIDHPHAIETAPSAKTGAGYLVITNTGDTPDRLLEIRTGFPRTEIHSTEIDDKGVASMRKIDGLDLAPGETVALEPGGMHVMFMGLDRPLEAGTMLDATLVFQNAGEVPITFMVEPRDGTMEMDHDAMGHIDHDMPGMTN